MNKVIKGFQEREEDGVLQWYCEATGRWVEYTQPQAVERRRELAEEQADREFNYDAEDEYL